MQLECMLRCNACGMRVPVYRELTEKEGVFVNKTEAQANACPQCDEQMVRE